MSNSSKWIIRILVLAPLIGLIAYVTVDRIQQPTQLRRVATAEDASVHVRSWYTDNGAKVMFVQAEALPILDVQVTFNAGSARDAGKDGLAAMVNHQMLDATERRSAAAIAEEIEFHGAQFSHQSYRDMSTFQLRSLSDSEHVIPLVELFSEILSKPAFVAPDLERNKKLFKQNIRLRAQEASSVAWDTFFKTVYAGHAYSFLPHGTLNTVESITLADLKSFHQRYYVAANANISIVGDVSEDDAAEIADLLVSGLPKGVAAPTVPVPAPQETEPHVHVAFPSSQTHILFGHPMARRSDPDYFPMSIANDILGGGHLESRLFNQIRNKSGLAYQVNSFLKPMAGPGPFAVILQTRGEKATEGLTQARQELEKLVDDGPSEEEVYEAKRGIVGRFYTSLNSNKALLGELNYMGFYKLPIDAIDHWRQDVEAVSLEDVRRVLKKRFDPRGVLTVTVGTVKPEIPVVAPTQQQEAVDATS